MLIIDIFKSMSYILRRLARSNKNIYSTSLLDTYSSIIASLASTTTLLEELELSETLAILVSLVVS